MLLKKKKKRKNHTNFDTFNREKLSKQGKKRSKRKKVFRINKHRDALFSSFQMPYYTDVTQLPALAVQRDHALQLIKLEKSLTYFYISFAPNCQEVSQNTLYTYILYVLYFWGLKMQTNLPSINTIRVFTAPIFKIQFISPISYENWFIHGE